MQVAATSELATSATLGGSNTIEFGISNDPAFFQVLSANLYSNQKLAVAREVISNSWDAHIEAGIKDTPIKISLLASELVFQDFGHGIAPEDMGRVYGTYGASTKKTDSKTTGGFGLGCKSPFAYTDSFRVTSCHKGVKTIYNITKSSVESNGKPGITTIASMPTDETGLTVSVPMAANDWYEFATYIKYVVMHGEINAVLTTEREKDRKLDTMGMSFEPGSYLMDSGDWYDSYMGNHSIFIRYGTVLYPMLKTPTTADTVHTVERFMQIIGVGRVVVQAAPDTLALTPSREALSSQKMTEGGLVDLVTDLVDRMEADVKKKIPGYVSDFVSNNNWRSRHMGTWTPWWDYSYDFVSKYLGSRLGKSYRNHYKKFMQNQELKYWVDFAGVAGTSLEAPLKTAVADSFNQCSKLPMHKFRQKYLIKPMLRAVGNSNGLLNTKNLRLVEYMDYPRIITKDFMHTHSGVSIRAAARGIMNNLVFASTRMKDIMDSVSAYPDFKNTFGADRGDCFVYRLSPKADARADELLALRKAGYTVVDLTQNYEWDPMVKQIEREAKQRAVKPKVENKFVSLRNAIGLVEVAVGTRYDRKIVKRPGFNTDAAPTWTDGPEKPLYYVNQEDINNYRAGFLGAFGKLSDDVLDNCIVARNGIERRMAENRGAISLDRHLILPTLDTLFSKEMKKYLTKERKSCYLAYLGLDSDTLKLMELLDVMPASYKKLQDKPEFESVLKVIDDLSLHTLHNYGDITDEELEKIQETLKLRPAAPSWVTKVRAIERDDFIEAVGIDEMINALEANPERKAAFRSLVLIAMKNGNKSDE